MTRAMLLEHPGKDAAPPLRSVSLAELAPESGEIAIEVRACGVCRTDLQLCDGDLPTHRLPIVPGHQIVGRVVSVGAHGTRFAIGDRVGVGWLASTCGACKHCLGGRENLCELATFTGWDRDGGFATHAIVRADYAFRIPDAFSDVAAAPLLCGGVIGHRALARSGVVPGQKLGLYGFGASATITIQLARAKGCRVFVCTRSKDERTRALDLGAEWAGGYEERPPEALDGAITFAPSGDVVVEALRSLDRGGTVAINAIHLDRIPQFSYDALWLERNIVSVANYTRRDAEEFLALAAKIPIRTVYETFALGDANTALDNIRSGRVRNAAVLAME